MFKLRAGPPKKRESIPGRGKKFFPSTKRPDRLLGPTWPRTQTVPGARRLRRKAEYSTLSSANVMNAWNYTTTPTHAFMASPGTTSHLPIYAGKWPLSDVRLINTSFHKMVLSPDWFLYNDIRQNEDNITGAQ